MLDAIKDPSDLRKCDPADLRQIADELRQETINAVSVTGGHLGAGLGVVELTVALHYVFDTPRDRLVWDVGHQAYPHKILTRRRDRIRTLRMGGGLSGFTKRAESEYDPFGAAHASTSISAGLGMAVARDLDGKTNNVIAVIGDGSIVGRHGLRGNEQRRRDELPPDRHPQRQRHVDRAPGWRDVRIFVASALRRHLSKAARHRQAACRPSAEGARAEGAARRGIRARLSHRRHDVRGTRLLLRRPDRRSQPRPPPAGAQECARRQGRADPDPCRDAEGQGLRAGRSVQRQVPRRRQVRCRDGAAGQGEGQRAVLHQGVRREPRQGSRARTIASSR